MPNLLLELHHLLKAHSVMFDSEVQGTMQN